ncbi:LacI family DNA-binding transcriptional regulator [Rhodococcus sp. NBC_00297]|uniref:LacI family DNA-binding transcriptional regulator n=1 Tax=Rhodococcus sp. NBC_00297 TaxID=2976005 RepID=UPI002E2BA83E|nr:LacI family DNA-binding transcriptional regulator [Rhodococcus sp. NBC_00297]
MAHRYRVREIAQQAELSEATVDRVLNDRPGVRPSTREMVARAIADLDGQREQLRFSGRKYMLDVVMSAPDRFSKTFKRAVEAELPSLEPATVRARFHLQESATAEAVVARLNRLSGSGSQGVILKAPAAPDVAAAVDRLVAAGIPVVTYVTDIPGSRRSGYVGMDNRAAGETAAYLITTMMADRPGDVLVTLSSNAFHGEEEREMGFRTALRRLPGPVRTVVEIAENDGLDDRVESLVLDALDRHPTISAVYSCGGGNSAIVRAFRTLDRPCRVFVAHDLDADNRDLLYRRQISAVLEHDMRADAQRACRMVLHARDASTAVRGSSSPIRIVTPFNMP